MLSIQNTDGQGAPPTCDYDLAAAHIAALTGRPADTAVIDVRCLSDTDKSLPGHAKRGTLSGLWPWIEAMNVAGFGVFVNVSEMDGCGRELSNVTAVRAHVLDLDSLDADQQRAAAAAWSPAPTFQVETSPSRWHIYWILSERYADRDRYTALQRRMRQQWNGDKAVVDPTRVLRLAGSWNRKRTDPHLVRCEALAGWSQRPTVDQLEASLSHVHVIEGGGDRHELGTPELAAPSLDWLRRALDLTDPNTLDRDDWISTMAAVKQAGWSLTDEPTLRSMWDAFCSRYEADDPAENEKQWSSIRSSEIGWPSLVRRSPPLKAELSFGHGSAPVPVAANDDRKRTFDASNLFVHVLDGDDEPVRFHIEGLIPEEALVPIYGAPKEGKTFVGIDMGASVATGTPFHGHATRRGTVFYICGEGFRAIKSRFRAWESVHGASFEGAPLFRSQCAVQFLDPDSAAIVTAAVDGLAAKHGAPRLVIIDTLARNFGPGDENSTADMGRFVAAVDALRTRYSGCSVIVIHHSGVMEKGRARGSGALLGAADAEYRVEKKDGKPTLYNTAMKDAATAPAMQFEFIEAAGSVALEYIGEPSETAGKTLAPGAQMTLEAFSAVAVDGRADAETLRSEFYKRYADAKPDAATGSDRTAFKRGMERLTEDALLITDDDGKNYRRPLMPGQPPQR